MFVTWAYKKSQQKIEMKNIKQALVFMFLCVQFIPVIWRVRFFFLDFICNCEGDFHLYSLTAVHSYDLLLHKYWDLLVIKTLYQIRTCCIVNQSDTWSEMFHYWKKLSIRFDFFCSWSIGSLRSRTRIITLVCTDGSEAREEI